MSIKRIFPIILLVWPYLIFPQFIILLTGEDSVRSFAIEYGIATVAICILNIVYVWTNKDEDAYKDLAFWNMLIKLVYIPFYIIISVLEIVMLTTTIIAGVGEALAIEMFLVEACLMVTTPMYGVSAIVKARKRGLVSNGYAVGHSILHFIIIASLVSSIVVYAKLDRIYKQQKQRNIYEQRR